MFCYIEHNAGYLKSNDREQNPNSKRPNLLCYLSQCKAVRFYSTMFGAEEPGVRSLAVLLIQCVINLTSCNSLIRIDKQRMDEKQLCIIFYSHYDVRYILASRQIVNTSLVYPSHLFFLLFVMKNLKKIQLFFSHHLVGKRYNYFLVIIQQVRGTRRYQVV